MKGKLLFLAWLFCPITVFFGQHVLFGERDLTTKNALYFDKDGYCYPNFWISDSALVASGSSLKNWYRSHGTICDSLFKRFGIVPIATELENPLSLSLNQLNDSILAEKVRELNTLIVKKNSITFFIHGFRKLYHSNGTDVTSVREFELLDEEFSRYGTSNSLSVYVYWDGLYDCCFSANRKKNKQLFELFESATKHADAVANALGKVIAWIQTPNVHLVGHSLGCQIATKAALKSGTTGKTIRVALIAPAMSADLIENRYTSKIIRDTISWMIVYNEDDFVLEKKDNKIGIFGPGAYRYGETTMGCNKRNEAKKWQKWMTEYFPSVSITLVDKTSLEKCHSLRCYTQNGNLREVWNFVMQ